MPMRACFEIVKLYEKHNMYKQLERKLLREEKRTNVTTIINEQKLK